MELRRLLEQIFLVGFRGLGGVELVHYRRDERLQHGGGEHFADNPALLFHLLLGVPLQRLRLLLLGFKFLVLRPLVLLDVVGARLLDHLLEQTIHAAVGGVVHVAPDVRRGGRLGRVGDVALPMVEPHERLFLRLVREAARRQIVRLAHVHDAVVAHLRGGFPQLFRHGGEGVDDLPLRCAVRELVAAGNGGQDFIRREGDVRHYLPFLRLETALVYAAGISTVSLLFNICVGSNVAGLSDGHFISPLLYCSMKFSCKTRLTSSFFW